MSNIACQETPPRLAVAGNDGGVVVRPRPPRPQSRRRLVVRHSVFQLPANTRTLLLSPFHFRPPPLPPVVPAIDTIYGQRQGLGAKHSVNGTAVLGEMFEHAGHRVFSWNALSPRLQEKADCIVWFPNDFEPPKKEVRKWLDDWLTAKAGRTLIYVGRDFDAAPWYWKHVLPDATKEQRQLVEEELSDAESYLLLRTREAAEVGGLPMVHDRQFPAASAGEEARRRRRVARRHRRLEDRHRASQPDHALQEGRSAAAVGQRRAGQPQGVRRQPVDRRRQRLVPVESAAGESRASKAGGQADRRRRAAGKTVVFLESYAGGPPIRPDDPDRRGASTAGKSSTAGRPTGSCCTWPPSASSSASRAGRSSAGRRRARPSAVPISPGTSTPWPIC